MRLYSPTDTLIAAAAAAVIDSTGYFYSEWPGSSVRLVDVIILEV